MLRATSVILAILTLVATALTQADSRQAERDAVNQSFDSVWYLMGFLAVAGLGFAGWLWWRSKKGANKVEYNYKNRYANYYNSQNSKSDSAVDAEMELEWLRNSKGDSPNKNTKIAYSKRNKSDAGNERDASETKGFQDKMRKLQYSQLPINSFSKLAPAKRYTPLKAANDPALLAAIEEANDEFEEDEAVRELSLKVLAAFRNWNSVEALSQMALYDLSANLRSKAVSVLAEFDHESVFETILLACADPTREVRAAAARGLFSLGFDRAHAWKRLIEAGDIFRLTQAARAATESGIVGRSLERLIHEDTKVAYEAFALVSLLIKAGETKELFDTIENHKDERVKFALLHVFKVQKDERTIEELTRLALAMSRKPEILEKIKETITAIQTSVHHEAWQTPETLASRR
ncbi:MAG: HEAT repeat domain-containing protein [Pyrinomonadaceae bacterium]